MNKRELNRERRRQRALERLGRTIRAASSAAIDDPLALELHHIAGQAFDGELVPVCRNCHRRLSDWQKDHPPQPSDPPSDLERIGMLPRGLADLFELLVKRLREFAAKLFALEPRPSTRRGGAVMNDDCHLDNEAATWLRSPIACRSQLRAFAPPPPKPEAEPSRKTRSGKPAPPSEWTLVFDTETTVDAAQRLRIGAYQFRKGDELDEAGLFYDPGRSSATDELACSSDSAASSGLKLRTVAEFVDEVLYRPGL